MKAKFLLLFPLLLTLTSCGETEPKEDAPIMELSGSFVVSDISSYADIRTERTAQSLIQEAEAGIPTYVLFARETCTWCNKFEPHFINSMKKLKRNIYVYYYDAEENGKDFVVDNLHAFQGKYGTIESEGGISGKVPAMYYLDGTKMNIMDMYEDNGSTLKFTSYMQYETRGSEFYRFSSYGEYQSALASNPSVRKILYNSSDPSSIQNYAEVFKTSYQTKTFVLDYSLINEKSEALAAFGLASYSFKII